MPYNDQEYVKAGMKPSPSLIYSNLCVAKSNFMYAHGKNICSFPTSCISNSGPVVVKKNESQHMDVIHTISSCIHNDITYVVLATDKGIQIWDEHTTHQLHTCALPRDATTPSSSTPTFARGVCTAITSEGTAQICFGSSSGSIHAIPIQDEGKFSAALEIKHHVTPIMCLASAYHSRRGRWAADVGCEVVSCDEDGIVTVWQASGTAGGYKVLHTISSRGVPCVAAAVRNDFAILARLDGAIQIYGLKDGKLRADIGAHSRFLSAMDLHPEKDVVATASEDCTMNVWSLPIGGKRAECLLSVAWLNAPLTGVAFCGANHDDLAVVAYDTDEIHYYKYSNA